MYCWRANRDNAHRPLKGRTCWWSSNLLTVFTYHHESKHKATSVKAVTNHVQPDVPSRTHARLSHTESLFIWSTFCDSYMLEYWNRLEASSVVPHQNQTHETWKWVWKGQNTSLTPFWALCKCDRRKRALLDERWVIWPLAKTFLPIRTTSTDWSFWPWLSHLSGLNKRVLVGSDTRTRSLMAHIKVSQDPIGTTLPTSLTSPLRPKLSSGPDKMLSVAL